MANKYWREKYPESKPTCQFCNCLCELDTPSIWANDYVCDSCNKQAKKQFS